MTREGIERNGFGRSPRIRWGARFSIARGSVYCGLFLRLAVIGGMAPGFSASLFSQGYASADGVSVVGSDGRPQDPAATAAPAIVNVTDAPAGPPSEAAPAAAAPAPPPAPESQSYWHFKWLGWDGIDFEVQEKTSFTNPSLSGESETLHALSQFSVERMTFHAKIGIRMDVDATAFFNSGDAPDPGVRMELRRFRILTKGDLQLLFPLIYQIELGYVPTSFYVENMYIAMDGISYIGRLKFGSFSAPMGFENMMSSRWISFMEAASVTQALTPGVNVGLQMNRTFKDDRISLQAGFFGGGLTKDTGDASQNYGRLVGRMTYLLKVDEGDDPDRPVGLTHVGGSVSDIYSGSGEIQYRSRPESHLSDYAIDTGVMDGTSSTTFGAEFVRLNGRHLIQSEVFLLTGRSL